MRKTASLPMGGGALIMFLVALLFGGVGLGTGPAAARGAVRQGLPGVKSLPAWEARPVAPGSEPGNAAAPVPVPAAPVQDAGAFRSRAEHWRHFLERWHFVSVFDEQVEVNPVHFHFVRAFLSTFADVFPSGGAPAHYLSGAKTPARVAENPAWLGAPPMAWWRFLVIRKGADLFPQSAALSDAHGGGGLPGIGLGAPPFYYLFVDLGGAWLPPPADLAPGLVYTLDAGAGGAVAR